VHALDGTTVQAGRQLTGFSRHLALNQVLNGFDPFRLFLGIVATTGMRNSSGPLAHRPDDVRCQGHTNHVECNDPGGFDLIHSRAGLTHLGARDVVLGKMIRALRPGGWLLLEESDGFPLAASGSDFFIKTMTPMVREWTWARKLPCR
jgi:hypothetical protein